MKEMMPMIIVHIQCKPHQFEWCARGALERLYSNHLQIISLWKNRRIFRTTVCRTIVDSFEHSHRFSTVLSCVMRHATNVVNISCEYNQSIFVLFLTMNQIIDSCFWGKLQQCRWAAYLLTLVIDVCNNDEYYSIPHGGKFLLCRKLRMPANCGVLLTDKLFKQPR